MKGGIHGKIVFSISDGIHISDEFIFKIKSQPIDLKLVRNSKLFVFPLQRKLITSDILLATVPDHKKDVIFEFLSKPNLGKLLKFNNDTGNLDEISSFSQNDVNNSRIFYEHTHPFFDIQYLEVFYFHYRCQFIKKTYYDVSFFLQENICFLTKKFRASFFNQKLNKVCMKLILLQLIRVFRLSNPIYLTKKFQNFGFCN